MTNITYAVYHDGEIVVDDADTAAEAKKKADEWWDDENEQHSDNVERSAKVQIVGYDSETYQNLTAESYTVECDCYHGDYAEHNTRWGV